MTDSSEPRPTALDLATDSIYCWLGLAVDDPDLADAVDGFVDQLGVVLASSSTTDEVLAAAVELARENTGAMAAGWTAYVAAINGARLAHAAAAAYVVAEAERIAAGQE